MWKPITYAPDYQISSQGEIKNKTGKILFINYERLKKTKTRARPNLYVDGHAKQYYLHRIVAQHFLENPLGLPEVNHKDGNFYNNKMENLEWISKLGNMKHANENNLINYFKTKIKVINRDTKEVTNFNSIKECSEKLKISKSKISSCCRGKSTDKKYILEYEDSQRRVINETDIIWKEYPEFKEYLVSNTGEVKNKKNGNILAGNLVNGYRFLSLSVKNKQYTRLVNRMVAMTFLENPNNLPVADHIDTNPLNNHVSNLRWCTYKENMNNETTKKKMTKTFSE